MPVRNFHNLRRLHHVAHLLAVRADVLHQRRSRLAGDVGEVFNPPPVPLHGMLDDVIPLFCGVHFQGYRLGVFMQDFDSTASRMHHHAVKSAVTHQDVAAASEDEKRQRAPCGKHQGTAEILQRSGMGEIPRGSADFESGVGLQRFRLF